MVERGKFITLEGGEGAGKSTLLRKLEQELQKRGYAVVTTREPGGTRLGETIRSWLLSQEATSKVDTKAELLLFLAARAQHIDELIKPALAAGKIVICDRFNDSTVAYQGAARGLGTDLVQKYCDLVCQEIVPDITFFLDLDPRLGLKRTRQAQKEYALPGELDRIEAEKLHFHERVRHGMQQLAELHPERIYTIDASQPPTHVFSDVLQKLETLF